VKSISEPKKWSTERTLCLWSGQLLLANWGFAEKWKTLGNYTFKCTL